MYIPEIPNNSLTEEIKEIVSLCMKLKPRYGKNSTWFDSKSNDEDIIKWEEQNGISIPESYKEWLRFTDDSQILNIVARFYGTKMIGYYNEYVDDDLIVIGEIIGDGEMLCFSKTTGKIVRFNHGKRKEFNDFKEFLHKYLIRILQEETY